MAAANITVGGLPATIESDTTGAVISNGTTAAPGTTPGTTHAKKFEGELRNHGPADVWLKVVETPLVAAAVSDVVTTGAQAQNQVPLPAGASIPISRCHTSIAHKTAAGTAILSWVPALTR